MNLPESLQRLSEELAKLPGVGRKTAQRLAFGILKYTPEEAQNLSESIIAVKENIRHCEICYMLTDQDTCLVCDHPERDPSIICVVEQPNNVFTIERSQVYKGVYHVLMGAISPLDGVGPEKLKFQDLYHRIEAGGVRELILATNPTVQGEATALFLLKQFEAKVPQITRLARGLPAGGDLEYVDHITLIQAFEGRQGLEWEGQ